MSGSKKTETTSVKTDPYAPAQANLKNQLDRARDLSNNTSNWTPTYSGATQNSIQGLIGAANNGSAAVDPLKGLVAQSMQGYGVGHGALEGAARGDFMNGNSALNPMLRQSNQDIGDQIASQLSGRGRFGDNAATVRTMTDRMTAANNTALAGQYNADMNTRMNAAGMLNQGGVTGATAAGQLDQANLYGTNLMGQAGGIQDAQAAAIRQAPMNAVQWQSGITNPVAALGSTTNGTKTQYTPPNTMGMIAGGLQAGIGAATGNPMMMAQGAGNFAGGASGGGGGFGSMSSDNSYKGQGAGQPFFGAFSSPYASNSSFNLNNIA